MRKSINGLTEIVKLDMDMEPIADRLLFVFCNKRRDRIKILYWDNNGFCLWFKRLEKHRFPWPKREDSSIELTYEQMIMVLKGIDFFSAHEKLNFSTIL